MPDKSKTLTFLYIASSAIKDAMTETYEWGGCPQELENEMAGILMDIDDLKKQLETL